MGTRRSDKAKKQRGRELPTERNRVQRAQPKLAGKEVAKRAKESGKGKSLKRGDDDSVPQTSDEDSAHEEESDEEGDRAGRNEKGRSDRGERRKREERDPHESEEENREDEDSEEEEKKNSKKKKRRKGDGGCDSEGTGTSSDSGGSGRGEEKQAKRVLSEKEKKRRMYKMYKSARKHLEKTGRVPDRKTSRKQIAAFVRRDVFKKVKMGTELDLADDGRVAMMVRKFLNLETCRDRDYRNMWNGEIKKDVRTQLHSKKSQVTQSIGHELCGPGTSGGGCVHCRIFLSFSNLPCNWNIGR